MTHLYVFVSLLFVQDEAVLSPEVLEPSLHSSTLSHSTAQHTPAGFRPKLSWCRVLVFSLCGFLCQNPPFDLQQWLYR